MCGETLVPSKILCKSIAKPWSKIAEMLGRPPILSYASYCLDNWHKINQDEGVNLDNVALNYNFLVVLMKIGLSQFMFALNMLQIKPYKVHLK